MATKGYLEGARMATAFNMLRSRDLIWPYFVNNYLRGKDPLPFDLLYWNSDATRMPAANHSFYLRNCYLENRLSRGTMEIDGERLDLKQVTVPIYNLATREDHIAPAKSVFAGSQCFGGESDLCDGRFRPHRRRHQSARSEKIPVLDRRAADRPIRELGQERNRDAGFMVAALGPVDSRP